MARLVVVSNRVALPRHREAQAGGLAVALRDAFGRAGGLWFGWSGELSGSLAPELHRARAGHVEYATLDLSPAEHESFYLGFANGTLWPLCHYRLGLVEFRRSDLDGYLRVNARFAEALAPLLRPDDTIWIHDYHFILMARQLRQLGVKNRIGFFLHIPFPGPDVLTVLPSHSLLMASLCHYDLIGLQTARDVRGFADYIRRDAGGTVDEDGRVFAFGRGTRVAAFPIGIDTDDFARMAESELGGESVTRLMSSLAGRELLIGVDRLDYSKGIPARIAAFRHLLETRPEHRGKVTFMQIAPVSRGAVAQYRRLRREIEGLAGAVNGRYAEFDWVPVRYLNKTLSRRTLAGFYRTAKVGIVTPLRDGMNLVAKEYVAAQDERNPGVLVLSCFAGAAQELAEAVIVNPFDIEGIADALHCALTMRLDERQVRWQSMMDHLRHHHVGDWSQRYLAALEGA